MHNINEELANKWAPVVEDKSFAPISDPVRKATVTKLLENTEVEVRKQHLAEANTTAQVDNFDPVLISLVRRAMPNLIAFDIAGVQPMNGPTGLIFALRSIKGAGKTGPFGTPGDGRTGHTAGGSETATWGTNGYGPDETFYQEVDTSYSGTGTHNPGYPTYSVGTGVTTAEGEAFGRGLSGDGDFGEMSFTIEKQSVEAKTRALKAEFTVELSQDLKAVHGLDAEAELSNILSTEILTEINRELIGTIRRVAKLGAAAPIYTNGVVSLDSNGDAVLGNAGVWDIDGNSDGRWSAEKYKSLLVKIAREANAIAKDTRRGRGNFIVCSSDVASILDLTGKMVYSPAIDNNLNVDDTGPTFVGVLQGRYKVFIDPYLTYNEVIVGYKGSNVYDAGLFYCPYVPLQMMRGQGENTFQPKIAFKTRYAIARNPFTNLDTHGNHYYRKFRVTNL